MWKRLFSSTPQLKQTPITITNNAWNKMSQIIDKQKSYSFIFSATSGGCNGFNYKLELINHLDYKNILKENNNIKPLILENNTTKVMIEPMSEFLLFGTTIDYIYEDFNNGVFENKFIFKPNKKLTNTCGCGISFTPKI